MTHNTVSPMPTPLQQVEQNLAEIAVSQISEKNPNLLNFYLGFDIIDKNDEGTRAAGIMGFKIGGQLVYIPVFFLNGKVRGMEVMYLKNSDTFVANNEQWVNYIASQNPEDIGHPAKKDQKYNDGETNNSLRIFSRPPASANSKAASLEDFTNITVDQLVDPSIALAEPKHDLVDFLKSAGEETYQDFIKLATENPEILKAALKFYDESDLKITFEKSAAFQNGKEVQGHSEETVSLVTSDEAMNCPECCKSMSLKDKEKIVRKGYAVKDLRPDDEKSDLYLGDYRKEFSQVVATGYYEILNAAGELVKALVFTGVNPLNMKSYRSSGGYDPQLVVAPATGAAVWSNDPVFARQGPELDSNPMPESSADLTEEEKKKVLDKSGVDPKDCKVGSTYILMDKDMVVYGPFAVKNKITDKSKVTLSVGQDWIPSYSSPFINDGADNWGGNSLSSPHYDSDNAYLRVTDKDGGKIDFVGGAYFIQKGVKAIEIFCSGFSCSGEGNSDAVEADIKKITPGTPRTLDAAISGRGGELVVIEKSATMIDVCVLHRDVAQSFRDRSEVVLDLMKRAGLCESSAEKLAAVIYEDHASKAFGWTLPRSQKVAYPDMITPQGAAGASRDGTPVQTSQIERQEMVPASPGPERATNMNIGLWSQVTKDDLDFLQRASDSNSRQVFDPAMVGLIVRTSRSQAIVQDYIPELVDNLDRMCRLLLLFYWHNQEFADEYGIDEMADFEDLLLSTIKSTAKVVLFLKQRAVESASGQTDVLE